MIGINALIPRRRDSTYIEETAHGGSSTGDLDDSETRTPEPNAEIDAIGWLFVATVAVITAVAALAAYRGNDTMIANAPVPHAVVPSG